MRVAHTDGTEDPQMAREQMAELARRYPGALREIDELELSEIQARIEALDATLRGEQGHAPWMVAVGLFHTLMRGALSTKRWLAGRRVVDEAMEGHFAAALAGLAFADDASAWQGELARVAAPPRGRVSSLVFERIALHFATTEAKARRLVFAGRKAKGT